MSKNIHFNYDAEQSHSDHVLTCTTKEGNEIALYIDNGQVSDIAIDDYEMSNDDTLNGLYFNLGQVGAPEYWQATMLIKEALIQLDEIVAEYKQDLADERCHEQYLHDYYYSTR